MKRRTINAAESNRWWEDSSYENSNGYDKLHPYFDSIGSEAYNLGYEMSGSGFDVVFTAKTDADKAAKITVTSFEEDGVVYFEPKMEFPVLDGAQMEFYDSMEYWTEKFYKASKICTELMKYPCVLDQYEPEEDEE